MKTLFQPLLLIALIAVALGTAGMSDASAGETVSEDQNVKVALERQTFHDRVTRCAGQSGRRYGRVANGLR